MTYDDGTFSLDPFYGHRDVDRDVARATVDRCDHAWSALTPLAGSTEVPASETGPAYLLEYANCPSCHTTLCREVAL